MDTFFGHGGDGIIELCAVSLGGGELFLGVIEPRLQVAGALDQGRVALLRLPSGLGADAGLGVELFL
jgi:hypothetical protein